MPSKNSDKHILWFILAVAALLRVYGIGFGLPLLSNFYIRPDESLIVQAAIPFFERWGYPGFFAYPALLVELCAIVYAVTLKPFVSFAENPSAYFLVPRAISVLAGTLTVLVVFRIGTVLGVQRWALWAAAFYAFAPLPVRDAHFGVTDTLMSLFVALSIWQAAIFASGKSSDTDAGASRPLWLAAVFFALAFSTKYTAALAAPALLAAVVEREGLRNWARILLALMWPAVIVAVIFVVLNPYVFLRFGDASGTVEGMFRVFYGEGGDGGRIPWSPLAAAWKVMLPLFYAPAGWAGLALSICATWCLVPTKRSSPGILTVALGTFPLLLALLPFRHGLPFRYLLPALPGIAVLAAIALSRWAQWGLARRALPAFVAVLVLWQAAISISVVRTLAETDTRNLAQEWLDANIPADVPVVILGTPEAEPQVKESARSIQRRIEYVYRLYGDHSGRIVSELYELLLQEHPSGREVYRNLPPEMIPGRRLVVVAPSYPLELVGQHHEGLAASYGRIVSTRSFDPLLGRVEGADFDQIDAFFLPMNPAGKVSGPGPRLNVFLVERVTPSAGPAPTTSP